MTDRYSDLVGEINSERLMRANAEDALEEAIDLLDDVGEALVRHAGEPVYLARLGARIGTVATRCREGLVARHTNQTREVAAAHSPPRGTSGEA
jgi:hypothetical protein